MNSAICTLGVLALLVAAGWVIELLAHRTPPSRMQRRLAAARSARSSRSARGTGFSQG
jgi:hypothetical protein